MRKNSKNFIALVVSVVLVFSMTAVAMFSAFADDANIAAKEGVTAEIEDSSAVAEESTTEIPDTSKPDDVDESTTKTEDTSKEDPATVEGLVGDVNKDKKVTSADARLALRICLKLEKDVDDYMLVASDSNNDKFVKSEDARFILRYALHIGNKDNTVIGQTIVSVKGSISVVTILDIND